MGKEVHCLGKCDLLQSNETLHWQVIHLEVQAMLVCQLYQSQTSHSNALWILQLIIK